MRLRISFAWSRGMRKYGRTDRFMGRIAGHEATERGTARQSSTIKAAGLTELGNVASLRTQLLRTTFKVGLGAAQREGTSLPLQASHRFRVSHRALAKPYQGPYFYCNETAAGSPAVVLAGAARHPGPMPVGDGPSATGAVRSGPCVRGFPLPCCPLRRIG